MDNVILGFMPGFLLGILLGILVCIYSTAGVEYKLGQIDALTGKIKYELVQHDDKTVSWEEIK